MHTALPEIQLVLKMALSLSVHLFTNVFGQAAMRGPE